MKRMYVRPAVMVETFNMTKHVSACAWDVVNLATPEECGAIGDEKDFNQPPITIFNNYDVCEVFQGDFENMMGEVFCYTASAENWTIFNS